MKPRHIRFVFQGILLTASIALGWTIDGTVVSSKGTVLQGVIVSVADSATKYSDTTDTQGKFSLQSNTSTSLQTIASKSNIKSSINGNILEIQNSHSGIVGISLLDATGKVLWHQRAVGGTGTLRIRIPEEYPLGTHLLRIQEDQSQITFSKQALALVSTAYPRLLFHKQGYQDTTYTMLSATVTGASIVMRDTSTTTTCPSQILSANNYNRTVVVGGVSRSYILHVPSAYKGNSAVPLVVDFHPLGGSGSMESGASPYKAKTDPEGVITAYPDGKQGPSGGAWNVGPCCVSGVDDTSFARALVADVKKVACIDPKRVYAVGFSMGGGMSHYTACHLADVFAAVAPAAFDLLQENVGSCTPSRPITVVSFRSTGDPVVNYNGGSSSAVSGMSINFLGAKGTFQKWAQLNQCTGSPSAEDANGCSTYSTCAAGVQVTLCTTNGGGHDYGNATVGWPLLKKYTLP